MTNIAATATSTPRYVVVSSGRNHYLSDSLAGECFVPFTSKRKAQERADEKNARWNARQA